MTNQTLESTSDDLFAFGVAELTQAEQVSKPHVVQEAARATPQPPAWVKPGKSKFSGFDPYNSGVFDKRKAWTSIRKR